MIIITELLGEVSGWTGGGRNCGVDGPGTLGGALNIDWGDLASALGLSTLGYLT